MREPKPVPPVAAQIIAIMRSRRLGTRRLAQLAGISHETLRRVLDGYDAKISTLDAIAIALKVPLADIIRRAA